MITVFVLYLVLVIGIAIWSALRAKTHADYVLGDKKIGGVSLALSERATGESAWLILGLTGHAFAEGISTIWVAIGCVIGIIFIWLVMANPLRIATEKSGAMTIPSLLARRFPGTEKSVGIISSLIVVFFFVFYIAAQFSGAGKVFHDTFGLTPFWGMVIGAGIVTLYTVLGGFVTVVATDVFQAVLMIFTLIVLPILLLVILASNNISLAEKLVEAGPQMTSFTGGATGAAAIILILNGLSWAFGYTGQPQLLARMMALKNAKDSNTAQWVATIWTIIAYTGAILIGIIGFALVKGGVAGLDAAKVVNDSEQILPTLVVGLMQPILAGILLSGAVSAMMSTASSELIVCSSSMSEDLYSNISKRPMKGSKLLLLNKLLTLGVGVLAILLVIFMKDTVYSLVSYAWAGIGSSFGPALLLLLFWKRFSRAGLYASLICGTFGAIIWKTLLMEPTGISERLGSYIFAFSMAVIASLVWPEKK
ncbi:MAG: sodium/proline symporter [Tenuifilaceae bacterium]